MSPEAQRIAIAEACGWTECYPATKTPHGFFDAYGRKKLPCGSRKDERLPDYLNDLNAMNQAEKILTSAHQPSKGESQWSDYLGWLGFCGENKTREVYECVTASAAQRAEAFLRVIGKWEEAK